MERWHEDVGCMHGNCISMKLGSLIGQAATKIEIETVPP